MFRFMIRDMLWLTVVVAVALGLWLHWSRQAGMLREESAAREAKLRENYAAEHDKAKERMNGMLKEYVDLKVKAKIYEAQADHMRAILRDKQTAPSNSN